DGYDRSQEPDACQLLQEDGDRQLAPRPRRTFRTRWSYFSVFKYSSRSATCCSERLFNSPSGMSEVRTSLRDATSADLMVCLWFGPTVTTMLPPCSDAIMPETVSPFFIVNVVGTYSGEMPALGSRMLSSSACLPYLVPMCDRSGPSFAGPPTLWHAAQPASVSNTFLPSGARPPKLRS